MSPFLWWLLMQRHQIGGLSQTSSSSTSVGVFPALVTVPPKDKRTTVQAGHTLWCTERSSRRAFNHQNDIRPHQGSNRDPQSQRGQRGARPLFRAIYGSKGWT